MTEYVQATEEAPLRHEPAVLLHWGSDHGPQRSHAGLTWLRGACTAALSASDSAGTVRSHSNLALHWERLPRRLIVSQRPLAPELCVGDFSHDDVGSARRCAELLDRLQPCPRPLRQRDLTAPKFYRGIPLGVRIPLRTSAAARRYRFTASG